MDNDIDHLKQPRNNKMLAGLVLLAVGLALLVRQLDFFFLPGWLFNFGSLLILIGLYIGARNNFRNPWWFILILVGIGNLPINDIGNVVWPIGIIAVGIWIILKRNHRWNRDSFLYKIKKRENKWEDKWDWKQQQPLGQETEPKEEMPPSADHPYGDDWIDSVSIFSGVKKTILSKDFKGGEIVNIFGGAELDFTHADIKGRVILDITQIFGGTKIIVPPHWQVVSDIAAIFASVDDKRIRTTPLTDNAKILVIKGASIFAGVDVRSF